MRTLLMGVTDRKKETKNGGKTPFFQLILYFYFLFFVVICMLKGRKKGWTHAPEQQ